MDALVEFLIQLILEVAGEFLIEGAFEGLGRLLLRRRGRWLVGSVAGLGFGCAWGRHLSGHPHYPRLLWVSITLGVVAGLAALRRGSDGTGRRRSLPEQGLAGLAPRHQLPPRMPLRRRLLAAATTWSRDRLIGLVCINAGLALGVVLVFQRG